ncbi:lycopene cyclase family protein [Streptomyces sp. NPDC094469]
MGFRTRQPAHGQSFGHVVPTGPRGAPGEYTEFSARPLTRERHESAVRHYAEEVLRLGERQVLVTETGVIPANGRSWSPRPVSSRRTMRRCPGRPAPRSSLSAR